MNIHLDLDANAQNAPAATKANWNAAASILGSMITDNITVNLLVHYTGTGGGASAGPLGGQFLNYNDGTANSVYARLTGHASPGDTTFSSLPKTQTNGGQSQAAVWDAQLKAMGIAVTDADDGQATFATDIAATSQVNVALHEFTHAFGRSPYGPPTAAQPDIFDFYRFTSPGIILISGQLPPPPQPAAYFSLNDGVTKWADYGTASDVSDFLNTGLNGGPALTPNDPFNETYSDGSTFQYLTPVDLEQMDALGFHLKFDAPASNPYDFTGNGNGDLVVQNPSDGRIAFASMLGGQFNGWNAMATVPGFFIQGVGKVSGNAASDVVIQNDNGDIDLYDTGAGQLYDALHNGYISGAAGALSGYNVGGVGDINDSHYADIVVQGGASNAQVYYANMTGGVFQNWVSVGFIPGWSVVAVADINGDGYADIVIQNVNTGQLDYANMNGGTNNGWAEIGPAVPGFFVVGAGPIERDGHADLVIENPSTSAIDYIDTDTNGGDSFGEAFPITVTPGFDAFAVDDINNSGFADILIKSADAVGSIDYIDMTGGTYQGVKPIANVGDWLSHTTPMQGRLNSGNQWFSATTEQLNLMLNFSTQYTVD